MRGSPSFQLPLAILALYVIILSFLSYKYDLHQPEALHHLKASFLNQYFVKIHWLYTTVLFVLSGFTSLPLYIASTIIWSFTTQSILGGPSLFDRIFTLSGGGCDGHEGIDVASLKECQTRGGRWIGGHDASGHVFLLTHCAIYGVVLLQVTRKPLHRLGFKIVAASTVALDVYMLTMTCLYFHTFGEKVSGLLPSALFWFATSRLFGWFRPSGGSQRARRAE